MVETASGCAEVCLGTKAVIEITVSGQANATQFRIFLIRVPVIAVNGNSTPVVVAAGDV